MLMALEELEFKIAAINAVIVVPMLAPRINGAAFFNETKRCATMGTTTDVVIVEERMAAVVVTPQKKEVNVFLKNSRLNRSGEFPRNKPEISFRKTRIEINNKTNDNSTSINPLPIKFTSTSTSILNPDQEDENVGVTDSCEGVKKYDVICCEIPDRNP